MQDTINILRTKLIPPKDVSDHVQRDRLVEKLNAQYRKEPFTLVSAPAGYGKSYLISNWLRANNIPFGWISLSEEENDLRTFLAYLLASLEKLFSEKLESTTSLLQASELPPVSIIKKTLINELDETGKEFALVFDDYHHIKEKKIHELIDGLLQYPPDSIILFIITRYDPPLKLKSLRAYNRMNEIRSKDLVFTSEEIQILYKNMLGLNISKETSEKLLRKTEGWITGLRLTAHSVNSVEQLNTLLQKMHKDNSFISEYLVEQVLSLQPEEHQKFLLKTSLLDRFCADLVEVLDITEDRDKEKKISGEEFIEWLDKINLFVMSLDEENKWYRYHHEFQRLLQRQLHKTSSSDQIKELHKRAGEWFEKKGLIDEAIIHAIKAGNPEKAGNYIETNRHDKLNQDQWYVVKSWLSKTPVDIINQSASLLLTKIRILNHEFKLPEIPEILKRLESLFKGESFSPVLEAEFYFSKAFMFFWSGEIEECLKYTIATKEKIPTDEKYDMIRGENELYYSISLQMNGNGDKAISELKEKIKVHKTKNGMYFSRVVASLCFVQLLSGELKAIGGSLKLLSASSEKTNFTYTDTWSGYMNACRYFNLSQFDESLKQFLSLWKSINIMHGFQALNCLAGLSLTYQFLNNTRQANKIIIQLSEFTKRSEDPVSMSIAESLKARLALLQGNLDSAENWLRRSEINFNSSLLFIWVETSAITACRVLIAIGSMECLNDAKFRIKELLAETKRTNNIFQIIDILVLQAITFSKLSMQDKAVKILKDALNLAAPKDFIRPFIEPGDDIINMLGEVEKESINLEFIKNIRRVFFKYKKISSPTLSREKTDKESLIAYTNNPLSNREKEIVSYLIQGYRNKDIANKISLSPTTVKKHIYNICKKLEVHSRGQVVKKVRESGIF